MRTMTVKALHIASTNLSQDYYINFKMAKLIAMFYRFLCLLLCCKPILPIQYFLYWIFY